MANEGYIKKGHNLESIKIKYSDNLEEASKEFEKLKYPVHTLHDR